MFFIKLFYFLKGYVIIEAEGLFIERFINICIHRGIDLKSLSKSSKTTLRAKIPFSDFKRLRPIVKKSGVKIKILKKCGLSALIKRYKKRYAFFIGALLFILFFAVTTRFVWSVEINGTDRITRGQVLEVLKTEGVYIGARKSRMSSSREIKDTLTRELPGVTWAWAYLEGCRMRIEIHEGTLPPLVIDKTVPCDVVAMRDGLVESLTVKEGEARAEENTAVMAGDVLIAGTTLKKDESGYRLVHAAGEVTARTWHEKTGTYTLFRTHRIPTGNKFSCYTLGLFSKTFDLQSQKNTYTDYDVYRKTYDAVLFKNYYLGISLTRTEYAEVELYTEPIPYESAVAFAVYDLEQKIAEELLPGAVLCDKKTTVKNIDDQTIEVTLSMEFTEKIGTQKIIGTD